MFDVSSRAKLSVSALAERKIASARPRKYGLLLRAEEEMLLYGQALARLLAAAIAGWTSWHRLYRLSKNSGLHLGLGARSTAGFAVILGGIGHSCSPWVQNRPALMTKLTA